MASRVKSLSAINVKYFCEFMGTGAVVYTVYKRNVFIACDAGLSVKPRSRLMKNVDFDNGQRLKVS